MIEVKTALLLLVTFVLTPLMVAWSFGQSRPSSNVEQNRQIAIINLSYVLEHHSKRDVLEKTLAEGAVRYEEQLNKFKKDAETIRNILRNIPLNGDELANTRQQLKELEAKSETNSIDAKMFIVRKKAEWVHSVEKEVREATRRFAEANNIVLVFQYSQAQEKNQDCGQCLPIYVAHSVDITKDVMKLLRP